MQRLIRLLAILAMLAPVAAFGQGAVLQGGSWTPGHVGVYQPAASQPVITDSGPASGGPAGLGLSEFLLTSRGSGTPPYVAQGTGPLGTPFCLYDAPITNSTGYHFLCLSPNVGNAGLIAYGAGGVASQQPLNFNINGATVVGATCSGSPTSSFATVNGIVTHC